ncbi:GMC family oxidoreductase N-terminal domain-containing protein [Streptomyces sp. NPDC006872]|uniref:GMC family oxidoreductase N-terminal domain-containing protein n=1 Tax=Streptomyces sp. NPDC006872 TaxID=3155720 RepID=UPI0033D2CFED
MSRTDVIVVGAGAAGATLAARLSEDSDRRVLLLEAGPIPADPYRVPAELLDARLVPGAQPGHPAVRAFPAHLTPGRPHTVVRGRYLGGSTTVNGGYFIRARREDFDRWAAAGNPAWVYERILPSLRAMETDLDFGAGDLHGADGPVLVRRGELEHPAAAAFAVAAQELGFPPRAGQERPEHAGLRSGAVERRRRCAAQHGRQLPAGRPRPPEPDRRPSPGAVGVGPAAGPRRTHRLLAGRLPAPVLLRRPPPR